MIDTEGRNTARAGNLPFFNAYGHTDEICQQSRRVPGARAGVKILPCSITQGRIDVKFYRSLDEFPFFHGEQIDMI